MASLDIPPALQKFTQGQRKVQIQASTLGQAIDQADRLHPGIKQKLVSSSGEILRFISIFVDQEDVKYLKGLETPIQKESQILVLMAMAGG